MELPADRTTVVEPTYVEAAEDQAGLLRDALRHPVEGPPLRELVRPGQTVAISMCDGTRPQPRHLMIPAVLDELEGIVPLDDVVVLVATGTHRGNTEAEIRAMLGDEVADAVRVVNHDARDDASLVVARPARSRRTRVPQPALGGRRRADHDRLRRAALLRRVQRRPQAGRARARGAGDGAHAARREADRRPAGDVGGAARATRCTTTSARSSRRSAGSTSRSTWCSTASSGSSRRSAARARDARGGPGLVAAAGDAARARAVRRGGHHQRGLPARPEPLPGREGHVGRDDRGEAGRHDRLRRRVPRRVPRPRLLPRGARLRAVAGGAARDDRGARAHRPGPVAGPGAGEGAGPTRTWSCARRTSPPPTSPRRTSATPTTSRRPCTRRCGRAGRDARVCVLPEGPQTIPYVA